MADIFISHATVDVPLANCVVQLLEGGIGVRGDQIFCTSLEGLKVPAGVDFKQYIQQQLHGASIVIGLISSGFYNSPFCMCELGATWVQAKDFIPLLISPITVRDLRGVLTGVQCLYSDRPGDLDELYARVGTLIEAPYPVGRWNARKEVFLQKVRRRHKTAKRPGRVLQPDSFKRRAQASSGAASNARNVELVSAAATARTGAANAASSATDTVKLFLEVYRYLHLLRNLHLLYGERKREEEEKAPSIPGPRAAAVLARLWATEDLGLPNAAQKVIAIDLGMAASELALILKELHGEQSGKSCVQRVSAPLSRENIYEITEEGKQQLTEWFFSRIAPGSYGEATVEMIRQSAMDASRVAKFVEALKSQVRDLLMA